MNVTLKLIGFLATYAAAVSAFAPTQSFRASLRQTTELYAASIQFVKGLEEKVVPDIKLTRAKDGSSGIATFKFQNPNVFDASTAAAGEITGLYMIDDEGEFSTSDVNANFSNGKPQSIEATYVMISPEQWDRFMRFMERYAESNGLDFKAAR